MNTTESKLAAAILKHLTDFGGKEGVEAISFLHRTLQQDGWRGLGNIADFEITVQNLGFTVRKGRNNRGQLRTEVTL